MFLLEGCGANDVRSYNQDYLSETISSVGLVIGVWFPAGVRFFSSP
jgi:hypothetical protein